MSATCPNTQKETKSAAVKRLLSRKSGATLAALQKATGWQAHSVRAALSTLRKSGHTIDRVPPKTGGGATTYRISGKKADA
jgi:predicted ArsR family transcriptional regulator